MRRSAPPALRQCLLAAATAALLLGGGAAMAGIALSPIMSSWSHNLRVLDGMLNGRTQYDEAAVRQALAAYIADASRVADHLQGNSNEVRDFRARFAAFAAAGHRALGHAADPAALRQNLHQMVGDCQSCHAAYN